LPGLSRCFTSQVFSDRFGQADDRYVHIIHLQPFLQLDAAVRAGRHHRVRRDGVIVIVRMAVIVVVMLIVVVWVLVIV